VSELKDGEVRSFTVSPDDAGLERAAPEALKGGDAEHNARAMTALLAGRPGGYRDFVLLNSAAALLIAGKAKTLPEGVAQAAKALDEGRAQRVLEGLVAITNDKP
jgi:anthranilate phosphoribosyltransferase